MEPKKKVVLSFVLLVIMVGGFYVFSSWFSQTTGYATGDDETVRVALCLREKGAVLYGDIYDKKSERQRDLFGKADEFLNYVECSTGTCSFKEIPVWEIDGRVYYGFKGLEELKGLAGC